MRFDSPYFYSATGSGIFTGSFTGSHWGYHHGDGSGLYNIPTSSILNWGQEVSRSAAYYGFGVGGGGTSDTASYALYAVTASYVSNIQNLVTYTSSFINQTSFTASHPFNTYNIFAEVYDSNRNKIIPNRIQLIDEDNVGVNFTVAKSGFIVLSPGGHLATDYLIYTGSVGLAATASHALVSEDLSGLTPYQIIFGDSNGNVGQSSYHSINNDNFNTRVVKVSRRLIISGSLINKSGTAFGDTSNLILTNVTNWGQTNTSKGAIILKLPQSWTNTMLVFNIIGYANNLSASYWEANISGINNTVGEWRNYSSTITGPAPFSQIRLGHDGKTCVIILGNDSTSWSYPKVFLNKVYASHLNISKWEPSGSMYATSGEYYFYFTGSISGFSAISLPKIYQYQSSASGYFGYGTTNPQSKIHVDSGDIRVTNGGFIGDGSQLTGISVFPYVGTAQITGSLQVSSSIKIASKTTASLQLSSSYSKIDLGTYRLEKNKSYFLIRDTQYGNDNIYIDSDNRIGFGAVPPNESKVYIYGGVNGANVDIRSDDPLLPAIVEVQAEDYNSSFRSSYLVTYGINAPANIFSGIPYSGLSSLVFQESKNAGIYTISTSSIYIGTDFTERIKIDGNTGNVYFSSSIYSKGDITSSGIFYGDGSGLTNIPTSSYSLLSTTSSVSHNLVGLTPYQILYGNSNGNVGQSSYHSINGENFNTQNVKVNKQLVVTGSIVSRNYTNINGSNSFPVITNITTRQIGGATVTGLMVLKLPQAGITTMLRMNIKGFNYKSNASSWDLIVSGYSYSTKAWANYSATIIGPAPFSRVRLSYDTKGNGIIILGDEYTTWNYPKLILSEVIPTHTNQDKWIPTGSLYYDSGEYYFYNTSSISWVTSTIRECTIYQYQSSASGYFGYGTTNPQSKIHISSGDVRITNGKYIIESVNDNYGYTLYSGTTLIGSIFSKSINGSTVPVVYGASSKPISIYNAGSTTDPLRIYNYDLSQKLVRFTSNGDIYAKGIISSSGAGFYGDGYNITNLNLPDGIISSSNQISGLSSSSISTFNEDIKTYLENHSITYFKPQIATASLQNAGVTYDWDMSEKQNIMLTLTASLTFNNPTNKKALQSGIIHLVQDGTGGKTLAFSSDFKGRNGNSIPSIITTALSASSIFYYTDGSTVYLSS